MEIYLLLTLAVFCALLWLVIVARDITRDRAGSAMQIEGAAVLRDIAKFLAAFGTPRIEVGQQDISQHGYSDDSCHYQCHAVYTVQKSVEAGSNTRQMWSNSPNGLALFLFLIVLFGSLFLRLSLSRITDLGHNRDSLAIRSRRS